MNTHLFLAHILYTVHRSTTDGDIIYQYNLLTDHLRLLSVMSINSYVGGQLSVGDNYLYYYSNKERRQVVSLFYFFFQSANINKKKCWKATD